MRNFIKSLFGVFALLIASCTQESITDDEKIAGTYVIANDFNAVYELITLSYGKMYVETMDSNPLLYQGGTLYSEENAGYGNSSEYTYSYKDGYFEANGYYSGPLSVISGDLIFDTGQTAKRVDRFVDDQVVSPTESWSLVYGPGWDVSSSIKMSWNRILTIDNITGWWHCRFVPTSNTPIKLIWKGSWSVNRGPDPRLSIINLDVPFDAIQDGNNLELSPGGYDIYLSGDAKKMVVSEYVIPVTSVSVTPSELSLNVGASSNLTAIVSPSDATDKSITWSSSNNSVASVDQTGKVTAQTEGKATISAKCGGYIGTCVVTVKNTGSTTGYNAWLGNWTLANIPITIKQKTAGSTYTLSGLESGLDIVTRYANGKMEFYYQVITVTDGYTISLFGIDDDGEGYIVDGDPNNGNLLATATMNSGGSSATVQGANYVANYSGTNYNEHIVILEIIAEKDNSFYNISDSPNVVNLPTTMVKTSTSNAPSYPSFSRISQSIQRCGLELQRR